MTVRHFLVVVIVAVLSQWTTMASPTDLYGRSATVESPPHPAVARIVVTEKGGMSFGSGTLIDVRETFGLVVTNWHVIRDADGPIEVIFPGGFHSFARPLKLDRNWDLAALIIWRPPLEPVSIASQPPSRGDPLTIAGYGSGRYRMASGRCTQYLAPGVNFPQEMVEVSVEARQGDSGGPIFNADGQLAGVLFGASHGTTMGSYAGRVRGFLASVAPDLADPAARMLAKLDSSVPDSKVKIEQGSADVAENEESYAKNEIGKNDLVASASGRDDVDGPSALVTVPGVRSPGATPRAYASSPGGPTHYRPRKVATDAEPLVPPTVAVSVVNETQRLTWQDIAGDTISDQVKTVLASIGALSILLVVARLAGS